MLNRVNAHRSRDHARIIGRAQIGYLRLFLETGNSPPTVDVHHSEAESLFGFDQNGCQSDVGARGAVLIEHQPIVHLVNVIARQDENVFRLLCSNRVDVLVDGVRGSHVPVLADALHRRQDLNELAQFASHDVPAFANMTIQRERFVLGEDVDATKIGINAIGKRDVDDAIDSAERDCRFGAIPSQRVQPFPRSSGQQDSKRVLHAFSGIPI